MLNLNREARAFRNQSRIIIHAFQEKSPKGENPVFRVDSDWVIVLLCKKRWGVVGTPKK